MDKILVTGNLGYNGVVVTNTLNLNGYYTIGYDTEYFQHSFFDMGEHLPREQKFKDIRDVVLEDLEGVDAVVHLAALSNDALGELEPVLTNNINALMSIKIARLAKQSGVKKFIYASSCSVYGIYDSSQEATEDSPLAPLTAYAKAKVVAEMELIKMADSDFRVVILRNATMHGLSPKLRLDLVVNNLTAYAHIYNTVKIKSDGTPWRPILSIEDFARVVLLFLKNDVRHIIYNTGFNNENYQIKDIGAMVSKITGANLDINPEKTPDERSYRVNFDRLAEEFPDLVPTCTLDKSIKQLSSAYKSNDLDEEKFLKNKFFRIRTLKGLLDDKELTSELKWNL